MRVKLRPQHNKKTGKFFLSKIGIVDETDQFTDNNFKDYVYTRLEYKSYLSGFFILIEGEKEYRVGSSIINFAELFLQNFEINLTNFILNVERPASFYILYYKYDRKLDLLNRPVELDLVWGVSTTNNNKVPNEIFNIVEVVSNVKHLIYSYND
jgi:hypothetical protein